MNSFGAMSATSIVLLALLMLASLWTATGVLLAKLDADRSAYLLASRMARSIDAFYFSACQPGAICERNFPLAPGETISVANGSLIVQTGGVTVRRTVAAPLSEANIEALGNYGVRVAWG